MLITLQADSWIRLKGLGGEALHGLFFDILRKGSAELASRLHRVSEQKPFSIFPLLEGHELRKGYSFIAAGKEFSFKLAVFNEEMLTAVISSLSALMAEDGTLFLSGKPITLKHIDLGEENFASFSQILAEDAPESTITLEFITPTSFKVSGIQALFPEPRLVFSSLLKRWNKFSEVKLPDEYMESFPSIKVSGYNLHTELIHFSRYKMIGFKGKVQYELPRQCPPSLRKAINALAKFACYAGVGVKTAMGMGQTKRLS